METESTDWDDPLIDVRKASRSAREALSMVQSWIWRNVVAQDVIGSTFPQDVAEPLDELFQCLETISRRNDEAYSRFCSRPNDSMERGQRLSREEFYLLRARGGIDLEHPEAPPKDDFEVFNHYYYEDEEKQCYIIGAMKPPPEPTVAPNGRTIIRRSMGLAGLRPPEECHLKKLRPEQKAYFEEYFPELIARFRKD